MKKYIKIIVLNLLIFNVNLIRSQEYYDYNNIIDEINKSKKKKIEMIFAIKYNGMGKILDDESIAIEKHTHIDRKHFTAVIGFISKDGKEDLYLPINDKLFNEKYYFKNIFPELQNTQTFINTTIKISIYKTDTLPIIVVNNMKLNEF